MQHIVWIVGVVTVAVAGWPLVTRVLPEPVTADPDKIAYRDTYSLRSMIAVTVAATVAMTTAVAWAPPLTWPAWALLATIGAWVVVIDAITTWIPAVLAWVGWAGWAVSVTIITLADHTAGIIAIIATVVIFAAWLAVWALSHGAFGFSDVRITPLWVAPAAATSIDTLHIAVIAGLVLVAVVALIDRIRYHEPRFIPWAPALCSGPLVGLAIAH